MAVSDWSTTAASNTSVGGINIAENCPAGNLNGAIREIMAEVADFAATEVPDGDDYVTKTGGIFTGNPKYTGRGGYLHHNTSTNTGGRIFIQASGGATPVGMANGDILLEY